MAGLLKESRHAWVLACLALLLVILPTIAQEEDFTYSSIAGRITITGYIGTNSVVDIPETIGGQPVTVIESSAFKDKIGIARVSIPNSVTNIGTYAFASCTNLAEVAFGTNLAIIRDDAFVNCRKLASVTLPDSVRAVGSEAFMNCSSMTNANLGHGLTVISSSIFESCSSLANISGGQNVTMIESYAFAYCRRLESYSIPANVFFIGNSTFYFCQNLTNINLGGSLRYIGSRAFSWCTALPTIAIPAAVTNIGVDVFSFCLGLAEINVDPLNPTYSSEQGILYDKNKTSLIRYPASKIGNDPSIPQTVTKLEDYSFSHCYSLTSVTIPSNVTNIGRRAFYSCSNLNQVAISANVSSIGYWAFANCISMTNIWLPGSVASIDDQAFYGCWRLTDIDVDPGNENYSSSEGVLFNKSRDNLIAYPSGKGGNYSIPTSVASVGEQAFSYCAGLKGIVVPASVTNIEQNAIYNCVDLMGVYFKGDSPMYQSSALSGSTNITVFHLPTTAGWTNTFAGRPTALWRPQMQAVDASYGVRANQFGFDVFWASGMTVIVETATNLSSTDWIPLRTNSPPNDTWYFSDPAWTNSPDRFYRVRVP